MSCAIGLVFEVATLIGVTLFDSDSSQLSECDRHIQTKIALLPKRIRRKGGRVDDDFYYDLHRSICLDLVAQCC